MKAARHAYQSGVGGHHTCPDDGDRRPSRRLRISSTVSRTVTHATKFGEFRTVIQAAVGTVLKSICGQTTRCRLPIKRSQMRAQKMTETDTSLGCNDLITSRRVNVSYLTTVMPCSIETLRECTSSTLNTRRRTVAHLQSAMRDCLSILFDQGALMTRLRELCEDSSIWRLRCHPAAQSHKMARRNSLASVRSRTSECST